MVNDIVLTPQELEDWKREHDFKNISPEVLFNLMQNIWRVMNGNAPLPQKYSSYALQHLDMDIKVLFYGLLQIYDKVGGLSNVAGFRGYFATLAELNAVSNPLNGDWAWVAEIVSPSTTANIWMYDAQFNVWVDSGDPIPSFNPVQIGTQNPKMDGVASPGNIAEFSPIDHIHPTDTSRASQDDFEDLADDVEDLKDNGVFRVNGVEPVNNNIINQVFVTQSEWDALKANPANGKVGVWYIVLE